MADWTASEIQAIADSDDLRISPFRADGQTFGTPTWIWSVVVDGQLFVRPYNGAASRWYRSAMAQTAGRIRAAGLIKEVTFQRADPSVFVEVDDAYRAKYAGSPYLPPMVSEKTRSVTVKVVPR